MPNTYHLVLVIENETTLQSSDLFINDLEGAKKHFIAKIKEEDPTANHANIQAALDEGWYQTHSSVVMYTEPYNIFGKES